MATADPLKVNCPRCGKPVTVPLTLTAGEVRNGAVQVAVSPDFTESLAHIQRHEARLATAAIRYGWTPEQAAAVPEYALDLLLADDEEA